MASPHVAGLAALYIAKNGRAWNATGVVNIRQALIDLAEPQSAWGPANTNDPDAKLEGLGDAELIDPTGTVNHPPTVFITNPDDGSTFDSGAAILFEGSASDTEDENLPSLEWTSSINGAIGTGGNFSTTLNDGNHTITAEVIDSGGKTGSASISITVGNPPSIRPILVESIDCSGQFDRRGRIKALLMTFAIVADNVGGPPVPGATVSAKVIDPTGRVFTGSSDTGSDGKITFKLNKPSVGDYQISATNVVKTGFKFNSSLGQSSITCHVAKTGVTAAAPPAHVNLSSESIVEGPIVELKLLSKRIISPIFVKVEKTVLRQNYPNPFNPETWIPLELSKSAHVFIKIYSSTGELVRTLNLGGKQAGVYVSKDKAAYWDGRNANGERVSSGVYFYRMEAGSFSAMKKMVIMK